MTFHGTRLAIDTGGSFVWGTSLTTSFVEVLASEREGRLQDLESELGVTLAVLALGTSRVGAPIVLWSECVSGPAVRTRREASEGADGAVGDIAAQSGLELPLVRVCGLACPNTTRGDCRQNVSAAVLKRRGAFNERISWCGDELRS